MAEVIDAKQVLSQTVLWQPDLMPPNDWLYPAILYHDQLSTIRPSSIPILHGSVPEFVTRQIEHSTRLSDLLGSQYVACQFDIGLSAADIVSLLDVLVETQRATISKRETDATAEEREWLELIDLRARQTELATARRHLEAESAETHQQLLAARAQVGAERTEAVRHIDESRSTLIRQLREIRRDVVNLGEIAEDICSPSGADSDISTRLNEIATRVQMHVDPHEPASRVLPYVLTHLLEHASDLIRSLESIEHDRVAILDSIKTSDGLTAEIERLERLDSEIRRRWASMGDPPGELRASESELAQRILMRFNADSPDGIDPARWSLAFIEAKSVNRFAMELAAALSEHPALIRAEIGGQSAILAPRALLNALFAELAELECASRGWIPMRGWHPRAASRVPVYGAPDASTTSTLAAVALCLPVPSAHTPLQEVVEFRRSYEPELRSFRQRLADVVELAETASGEPPDVSREIESLVRDSMNEISDLLARRKALEWRSSLQVLRNPRELAAWTAGQALSAAEGVLVGGSLAAFIDNRIAPASAAVGAVRLVGTRVRREWSVRRSVRQVKEGPLSYLYEVSSHFHRQ